MLGLGSFRKGCDLSAGDNISSEDSLAAQQHEKWCGEKCRKFHDHLERCNKIFDGREVSERLVFHFRMQMQALKNEFFGFLDLAIKAFVTSEVVARCIGSDIRKPVPAASSDFLIPLRVLASRFTVRRVS